MRLIDADKLMENKFKNDISYNAFCNLVKRQPSIDAVPVIRCKDCKYAYITNDGECKYCDVWFPDEAEYMDGDYYCASAEREES